MKSFAAHHQDMADGHLLEPFEILREVPGDFASRANHAIERHRGYGFEIFHGRMLAEREWTVNWLSAISGGTAMWTLGHVAEFALMDLDSRRSYETALQWLVRNVATMTYC